MAKLLLTKLHCERQQDISGQDEPVIFIGGLRVWNGKLDKGKSAYPNLSHTFEDSVLVELKENNGGNLDTNNKLLGSWRIAATPHAPSTLTATSSGYHYILSYDVD